MARNVKPATLGQRIRRLRKKHDMSLDFLARETTCHRDNLEKIENDSVIPPVATLLKLSRVLNVASDEFLRTDPEIIERRLEATRRRTDHYSYQLLTPESAETHLKGFLVTIDPMSDLADASYQHDGEELIYVLNGEVAVKVGEDPHTLQQGQSLHFDSNKLHALRNNGDIPCELLVVLYTP